MYQWNNARRDMSRKAYPYKISNEQMGSIMDKMKRSLRDEIRAIAKEKGITAHLLVEIYLERCVKQYKTQGF